MLGINKDSNFVLKSFVCIEVFQVLLFLIKTHVILNLQNDNKYLEQFLNIYGKATKCHLHELNKNSIILIIESNEKKTSEIHIIEFVKDKNLIKFKTSLISNLNEILKVKRIGNICTSVSCLNNYLVVSNGINISIVNIDKKKVLCSTDIQHQNSSNFKLNIVYPISNTNDFIGLGNNSQLFYIQYEEKSKKLLLFSKTDLKVSKVEIMKNLIAILVSDELKIYNLSELMLHKMIPEEPLSLLKVNHLEYFAISSDAKYVSVFENPKTLSLYRLKDSKKSAQIRLYNSINDMIVSEKFVSIAMKDRRVLSYLIVDPLEVDHRSRIKELPSR